MREKGAVSGSPCEKDPEVGRGEGIRLFGARRPRAAARPAWLEDLRVQDQKGAVPAYEVGRGAFLGAARVEGREVRVIAFMALGGPAALPRAALARPGARLRNESCRQCFHQPAEGAGGRSAPAALPGPGAVLGGHQVSPEYSLFSFLSLYEVAGGGAALPGPVLACEVSSDQPCLVPRAGSVRPREQEERAGPASELL